MVCGIVLFSALLAPPLSAYPEWVWWTPPSDVGKADRFGLSVDQVLAMGTHKWYEFAYEKYQSRPQRQVGSDVVWSACMKARNDVLLAKLQTPRRRHIERLRKPLFLFAMSCIALEDTLAGGGTYSVHEPRSMWGKEEGVIYALIQKRSAPGVTPDFPNALDYQLNRFLTGGHYRDRVASWGPPDPSRVHRDARRIKDSRQLVDKLSARFPPAVRTNVTAFEKDYLIGYLGIRGADGTKP